MWNGVVGGGQKSTMKPWSTIGKWATPHLKKWNSRVSSLFAYHIGITVREGETNAITRKATEKTERNQKKKLCDNLSSSALFFSFGVSQRTCVLSFVSLRETGRHVSTENGKKLISNMKVVGGETRGPSDRRHAPHYHQSFDTLSRNIRFLLI